MRLLIVTDLSLVKSWK